MHFIWTIIIGFIAGVIAKFITPGDNCMFIAGGTTRRQRYPG
jgi:uncharacterized membrane protein YeaQ/YmgE (transglycosylase-associated protein family)